MKKFIILWILIFYINCHGEDLGFKKDCEPLVDSTLISVCLPVINNSQSNKIDSEFYLNMCLLSLINAQNCD